MKVISLFFSVFVLALDSASTGVFGETIKAVQYTFNAEQNRFRNTGIGDPSPSSSLDGTLIPKSDNGVSFVEDKGRDGTAVAKFTGNGYFEIPESVDVNMRPLVGMRMISLDFYWNYDVKFVQVLYEEGNEERSGFNIYLDDISDDNGAGKARLRMAVWQSTSDAKVIQTDKNKIKSKTWYQVEMVLDEISGTISGYLDDKKIDEKEVDFFPIRPRSGASCVGGSDGTIIFSSGDAKNYAKHSTGSVNGEFKGLIDNFIIRNEVPNSLAVEYTFSKDNPKRNTGSGGGPNLDWTNKGNGIEFNGIGAGFSGKGCIRVPDSRHVNLREVSDRMISLDFKWGGTDDANQEEILFEEGGNQNGINMYLNPLKGRKAELVMGAWKDCRRFHGCDLGGSLSFVKTPTIKADIWYTAILVLDRYGTSTDGILTGYLDGVDFGVADVDFFPIREHSLKNCIGGMRESTRLSTGTAGKIFDNGSYFNGRIDNFRLYNSVVLPLVPTASPTVAPSTTTPSMSPSISHDPSMSPSLPPSTSTPSMSPSISQDPSMSPSLPPSTSFAPTADPLLIVKYTFNDSTNRTKNTGDGDPSPSSSLDGILVPADTDNGIDFLDDYEGNAAARFQGAGCIQVPQSFAINGRNPKIGDRTIALDFKWDGTDSTGGPQILFEEGNADDGINMYIDSLTQNSNAMLVMAAWKTDDSIRAEVSTTHMIQADTLYHVSLVLDKENGSNGCLQGYLNGEMFDEKTIDFFDINKHTGDHCLGGMKTSTFIVGEIGASTGDGFYFHGLIENFRIYNSVQIPTVPPTSAPTTSNEPTTSLYPTSRPSSEDTFIATRQDLPDEPTAAPSTPPSMSLMPSMPPSTPPSLMPSMPPSTPPSTSLMPSISPSTSPLTSFAPTADRLLIVKYTFDDSTIRTKNTGDGDPSPSSSLDGILVPADADNGIDFIEDIEGNAARFQGQGCMQVPRSAAINGPPKIGDRTIALHFKWDGNDSTAGPQMLFEEGNGDNGINMYLDSLTQSSNAMLVMGVWETTVSGRKSQFVNTTRMIQADTLYHVSLGLDRVNKAPNGNLQGYLNGEVFDEKTIDFFDINNHGGAHCLGGMKTGTFIVGELGDSTGDGFYFHGLIDNFELYNSVQIPAVPPKSAPTTSHVPTTSLYPTSRPSSEDNFIAILQDLPDEPTVWASLMPSITPSMSPSEAPSPSPSTSIMPSVSPSTSRVPTSAPTMSKAPSTSPSTSIMPSETPSTSWLPTSAPTMSKAPSTSPSTSIMPSITPSTSRVPTSAPTIAKAPSTSPSMSIMPSETPSTPSTPPTVAPTTSPGSWINITYDDFENSEWGHFESNGWLATRMNDPSSNEQKYVHQGTAAIRIRWRYGSFAHAQDHNVTEYSNLRVHFWYYPVNMGQGDGFLLEYLSNSGTDWTVVKAFIQDQDFDSTTRSFYEGVVDFDATNTSYELSEQARIRFRCNANGFSDSVYIDEVSFQGLLSS